MIDVRSLDLSRTSITNGGFAGNGLEVVIPEGGFRGLGPLEQARSRHRRKPGIAITSGC